MRWWHFVLGLVGLIILVVVVGVVLLSVQDVNKFKDFLIRKVSERTGRELIIAGNFDLSISFSPSITADNVTFENAAWGTRSEMLKLGHVEAKVALFPMLGGDIEVERLILEDMDLLVETNEDGVGNWVFGEKKAKVMGTVEAENCRSSRISRLGTLWCVIAMARPSSAMW